MNTQTQTLDWNQYKDCARQIGQEGCVLLENAHNTLPLSRGTKLAVFGRMQNHYYNGGTGSGGMVCVDKVITIMDALKELKEDGSIILNEHLAGVYAEWERQNPIKEGIGWGQEPDSQEEMPVTAELAQKTAAESDVALVIIARIAGEDKDNSLKQGSWFLTDTEYALLRTVRAAFPRMIVALNVGNLIDMQFVDDVKPDAVLYAWQAGMVGALGFADILAGKATPSGKLTDTIAKKIEDYPSHRNYGDKDSNTFGEDIYVGYRYFETFAPERVRYPFGFGLSYTTFAATIEHFTVGSAPVSAVNKSVTAVLSAPTVDFDVCVTNTGSVKGKHVVQIYCAQPQGLLGKPKVVLCGFSKTNELSPNEKQILHFSIQTSKLASFDDAGITGNKSCMVLEGGEYTFFVGSDCRSTEKIGAVTIDECILVEKLHAAMSPEVSFERLKPKERGTSACDASNCKDASNACNASNGGAPNEKQPRQGSSVWDDLLSYDAPFAPCTETVSASEQSQLAHRNADLETVKVFFPEEAPGGGTPGAGTQNASACAGTQNASTCGAASYNNNAPCAQGAPSHGADAFATGAPNDASTDNAFHPAAPHDASTTDDTSATTMPTAVHRLTEVLDGTTSMPDFLAQLTNEDLACIIRGEGMGSPKVTTGTAAAFGGVSPHLAHLGIPCGCCTDGPAGIRLDSGNRAFSLPIGTMLASTFNVPLITALFTFTGLEMAYHNVDILLGPGMNIHRYPLNGRNFEYFSEDPFITGNCASAVVRGLHSVGVSGSLKHFCANTQEFSRLNVNAVISERALREIYLKGYEIAVKEAQADVVMTTYGRVNGIRTAGNYDLNTLILRKEWGFTGIVMTDWWAYINEEHGSPSKQNFAPMIRAQNDLYMVCPSSDQNIHGDNTLDALKNDAVCRAELLRNAENIIRFLMHSRAQKRLTASDASVEIINRPKADREFETAAVTYHPFRDTVTIPLEHIPCKKGSAHSFGLDFGKACTYTLSVTAKTTHGGVAQVPITVSADGISVASLTWSDTGGEWETKEITVSTFSVFSIIRLYFAQNGLTLKEIRGKIVK